VFALSSIFEGLPGALIQAMACGCRVISTDCPGGSREILEGGALGLLVPPLDPPALAQGILRLLRDGPADPARLPAGLERFSERSAVDAYLQILGVGQS
jgi:glycosyltransferase involved in cell wall biosynthesis